VTEADTCRKYVVPKLTEAGWDDAPHFIGEQRNFTDGRVILAGDTVTRGKRKRADYLLHYTRDFALAVVEEEASVKKNFPDDLQTSETALLFLQLIMRTLARPERNKGKPGRAAVVVPNGTLFGDGVSARIKEELLKSFNLHTVVRLPNGVFSPYTLIPTNLLFFDRSGPTREIWYYELPLPEGRKNYTKTKPMQFEEFAKCIAWWGKRKQNDQAWKVKAADLLKYDDEGRLVSCNLDLKNPNSAEALEHRPPEELVGEIIEKEQRILEIMQEIQAELGGKNR
jgi:type I restriction enzyme M protein